MHPLLVSLDLDHPGLEAAKAAFEGIDLSRALRDVVGYFRGRTEPDETLLARPDHAVVPEADAALERRFVFQNVEATLPPGDWDWTYKPGRDWEWAYFLNRHSAWRAIASAYLATSDERYARELDTMIRSWVGGHPPSTDDLSCWRTLEAGLRMSGPWPAILPVLKSSPSITDAAWLYYLRSVHDHAEWLVAYPKQNNWLLMESQGLFTCGLVFPEFKRANDWVRIAIERFETEMSRQVHPDGSHIEYSTGYHFVAGNMFTAALDTLDRAHAAGRFGEMSFSDEYRGKLVAMWEYAMYLARPDGRLPLLNDADQIDVFPRLRAAAKRFGRADFLYVASNGAEGKPPAETSHRFPWVRRAVMRSGWECDAFYGFLETAPPGAGHVNEDALTFELMAYGRPLVGTMGRFTYEPVPRRKYLASAQGSNTVLIDGQEMQARRSDRSAWVATEPTTAPWHTSADVDVAFGRYEGPWSGDLAGIVWERRLAFHKPDAARTRPGFWVVRDTFSGSGRHTVAFLLHFFPGDIRIEEHVGGLTTAYAGDGGKAVVRFADPASLSLDCARGQDEPPRGWFSREYGKIEPAWEVRGTRALDFPAVHDMAFVPISGARAPEIEVRTHHDRAVVIIDGVAWPVVFPF